MFAVANPRYLVYGTSHEASRVLALKIYLYRGKTGPRPMHAFRLLTTLAYFGLISPLTTRMAGPPIITTYPSLSCAAKKARLRLHDCWSGLVHYLHDADTLKFVVFSHPPSNYCAWPKQG